MDVGYHTPLEEYLETIQALNDEGTEVIGARIAERLGRSAPAVKEMLEAGRWEHVISSEVEEKLIILLGDPATCPHGNPIPGHARLRGAERSLSSVALGEEVELLRITELVEHDDLALIEMEAVDFIPGRRARVASRGADGSIEIEAAGGRLAIAPRTAANCFVNP